MKKKKKHRCRKMEGNKEGGNGMKKEMKEESKERERIIKNKKTRRNEDWWEGEKKE